jgi:hypothetical protein
MTERPLRLLAGTGYPVVIDGVGQVGDLVSALDLPIRAGGVSFYRLIRYPPPVATRRKDRLPCL